MVVFDTSFIALAFDAEFSIPIDPNTGTILENAKGRIDNLISEISNTKQRILIPTPVLAEYLVRAGVDKDKRLQEFVSSKVFLVASFDIRAAIECAMIEDGDTNNGKKLTLIETKAKVKFDRQVIAIAKARGAKRIYTGDNGLADRARASKIDVVMTWDVPLPPEDAQKSLVLESRGDDE